MRLARCKQREDMREEGIKIRTEKWTENRREGMRK